MVVAGVLVAVGLVDLDRADFIPASMLAGSWLYNGGATGARTLLGAIASSTIGVAGTVFSITIAALSLAAGQKGPRVLRNFTHDRGDQFTLGAQRVGADDLEFVVRQLVEVAVRALSPGINDPHTAMSVLDRLGSALCDVATVQPSTDVCIRDGRVVLVVPNIDYDGLVDAKFHLTRQNDASSTTVLIRILEVLTAVLGSEADPSRTDALLRHANLVLGDAERNIYTPADLSHLRERHTRFMAVMRLGPIGNIEAIDAPF